MFEKYPQVSTYISTPSINVKENLICTKTLQNPKTFVICLQNVINPKADL